MHYLASINYNWLNLLIPGDVMSPTPTAVYHMDETNFILSSSGGLVVETHTRGGPGFTFLYKGCHSLIPQYKDCLSQVWGFPC